MSEPSDNARLPSSSIEITAFHSAVEAAAAPLAGVRTGLIAFAIASVVLLSGSVFIATRGDPSVDPLAVAAIAVAGIGVVLALFVVLPSQLALRRRRTLAGVAARELQVAAEAVRVTLADLGYSVPFTTVAAWLQSPNSEVTVALAHNGVIAARWWRPAEGDRRVFIEPYLRVNGAESVLPPAKPR